VINGFQSNEAALAAARKLVESSFWLPSLNVKETYARQHDDTDGEPTGFLNVGIAPDNDVWLWIENDSGGPLRFRCALGGGMSPRTRAALVVLAEAIRLDNEERRRDQSSINGSTTSSAGHK